MLGKWGCSMVWQNIIESLSRLVLKELVPAITPLVLSLWLSVARIIAQRFFSDSVFVFQRMFEQQIGKREDRF